MKKITIILVLFLCMVLMVSCKSGQHFGALEKETKTFIKYVSKDAYEDAIDIYNDKIAGDVGLEQEASACLESFMKDIINEILSGKYDKETAEIKTITVEKVYQSTNCEMKNYDTIKEDIEEALASKVAYKNGTTFFEEKNYREAIVELSKVLTKDSNYKDAMKKKQKAIELYKEHVLNTAKKFVKEEEHQKAIDILSSAVEILTKDSDLLAELNTIQKKHIAKFIEEADAIFTDYTKYEDALNIIQSALQSCPEDEQLKQERDYYLSFKPINLYDLSSVKGKAAKKETDIDTYKNEYEKCFWVGYGNFAIWSDETDIAYNLEAKYNKFTATVYSRSNKIDYAYHTITIYGDGQKLYENTKVVDNVKPFEISVDVTGISELRIFMDRTGYSGPITSGVGLTNMILQKTNK